MAITIDWGQSIIHVPRADMTLIQSSPTEIRELNTNQFRLDLKALEDGPDGMGFQKTHDNVPPISVGGITLARVIEVLEPYTITFEDGLYAVYLQGSNNNILDRTNKNQVSVNPSNSAGLVTSAAIEYGEYGGGVTIDTGNTTGNAASGSVYPTGTLRRPCNNVADALVICAARGFSKLYILGNCTFTTGHSIDDFLVIGSSHIQNVITLDAGAAVTNTVFEECEVTGTLDGNNELRRCIVGNLLYFSGHIHNSGLKGEITLAAAEASVLSSCQTIDPLSLPIVNMGGSGQDLSMPHYSGSVEIKNFSGALNYCGIGLQGGTVILDSTEVTNGTVHVSGTGELLDENGDYIPTGTWNTNVTIINTCNSPDYNAERVWAYER